MSKVQASFLRFSIKCDLDEDAGYALETERFTLLCAFDGMGGLGSRRFQTLNNYSSAFLASHLYANVLEYAFMYSIRSNSVSLTASYTNWMSQIFWEESQRVKTKYLMRETTLVVGSMSKTLPSTACIALVDKEENSSLVMWAGDSRAYFLANQGLYQLTRDHVKKNTDLYRYEVHDAPLSNYLNADQPFYLESRKIISSQPGVILVATDGAFGCFPTAFHFDAMLLGALSESENMEHWMQTIKDHLVQIANDDVTISMQPLGYSSFEDIKLDLIPRLSEVEHRYLQPYGLLKSEDVDARKNLLDNYYRGMNRV